MSTSRDGRSVLLIGDHLSTRASCRTPGEDLAEGLAERGWRVFPVSDRSASPTRLLHKLWSVVRLRGRYAVAQVDVFSGPAFAGAELVCAALRLARRPYVLTLHGGQLPEFAERHGRRFRRLLRGAAAVTCPSPYLARRLGGFAVDLEVVPNGIDSRRFEPKQDEPSRGEHSILWLRAFHQIYDPLTALEAFERVARVVPGARLTLAGRDRGDGTGQRVERALAGSDVADRVELHPSGIPHPQVPAMLRRHAVFLNTSLVDNMPVSVIEAMASGLCVVSTDSGGLPDLIDDGRDGLLAPSGDAEAVADRLLEVLTSPELAGRLGEAARAKARSLDWSRILPRWESILLEAQRDDATEGSRGGQDAEARGGGDHPAGGPWKELRSVATGSSSRTVEPRGLGPTLMLRRARPDDGWPAAWRRELRASQLQWLLADSALAALREVALELGEPAVLFKGGGLGSHLYPEREERPITDLDVLVDPRHLDRWIRALEDRGWRSLYAETIDHRYARDEGYAWPLSHPRSMTIELHFRLWRVLPAEIAREVRAAAQPLAGPSDGLRTPLAEHAFVLCAAHFWLDPPPRRLVELLDLVRIVEAEQDVADRVAETSERWQLQLPVAMASLSAAGIFAKPSLERLGEETAAGLRLPERRLLRRLRRRGPDGIGVGAVALHRLISGRPSRGPLRGTLRFLWPHPAIVGRETPGDLPWMARRWRHQWQRARVLRAHRGPLPVEESIGPPGVT